MWSLGADTFWFSFFFLALILFFLECAPWYLQCEQHGREYSQSLYIELELNLELELVLCRLEELPPADSTGFGHILSTTSRQYNRVPWSKCYTMETRQPRTQVSFQNSKKLFPQSKLRQLFVERITPGKLFCFCLCTKVTRELSQGEVASEALL